MSMSNNSQKYDAVTVLLHWLIGIGIFAIGGLELVREGFPKGSFLRGGLKALHQPAGTIIFGLILLRLMWRLALARVPRLPPETGLVELASRLMHLALYVLMIALPLLGMLSVFASNKSIDFGMFSLVMPLKDVLGGLAKPMRGLHEAFAYTLLVLAFVHAAAALVHHYVLKDGVLARMWLAREPRATVAAAE